MTEVYFTQFLADESATLSAALQMANEFRAGDVVFLIGDLGAGKTTFVRGVLHALGYLGRVKSPTYNIVETYQFDTHTVYHFDLYRMHDIDEWEAAGFREYFNAQSLCLIEWPNQLPGAVPSPDWEVKLAVSQSGRSINVIKHTQ